MKNSGPRPFGCPKNPERSTTLVSISVACTFIGFSAEYIPQRRKDAKDYLRGSRRLSVISALKADIRRRDRRGQQRAAEKTLYAPMTSIPAPLSRAQHTFPNQEFL